MCNHCLLLDSAGNNSKTCESECKGEGYPIKKTEGVRKSKYKKTKTPDSLCHDWGCISSTVSKIKKHLQGQETETASYHWGEGTFHQRTKRYFVLELFYCSVLQESLATTKVPF